MADQEKGTNTAQGAETPAQQTPEQKPAPRMARTLNNNVKEEIIVKRKKVLDMILYVVFLLSAIVFGLVGAVSLMQVVSPNGFNLVALGGLVVFGGGAALMWFGKDYLRVEYEYSFTNGIVDISQVLNNRRRKELITIKTREVELVAPIDDPRLYNIEKRQGIKKVKAVLNADSRIYFAVFRKNEQQYLVYFEPSEEFVRYMRMYNDRNVVI